MAISEQEAEQMAEKISRGEPCPICKAEWKPMSLGGSSREMWHDEDCEYINYYNEDEGSN